MKLQKILFDRGRATLQQKSSALPLLIWWNKKLHGTSTIT